MGDTPYRDDTKVFKINKDVEVEIVKSEEDSLWVVYIDGDLQDQITDELDNFKTHAEVLKWIKDGNLERL